MTVEFLNLSSESGCIDVKSMENTPQVDWNGKSICLYEFGDERLKTLFEHAMIKYLKDPKVVSCKLPCS